MIEFCDASYLNHCINLKVENKDKPISQRMYNCATCGLSGICEGCAVNFHINHSIEFVGVSEFCCRRKNTNNCIMMLAPLSHTNKSKCDRLDLEFDDISPCFTCYKCDKSGNKKKCETCALKKYANHDIHLVGYLKSTCSENEKPKLRPSLFKPKCTKV